MLRARTVVFGAFVVILAACAGRSSTVTHRRPTTTFHRPDLTAAPNVSVWGDSLTLQAAPALEAEGRARHVDIQVHAYFGLAPCDVTTSVLEDVGSGLDAIVFAFSGNNLTPCMTRAGHRLQGNPYFDAYRRDVGRLVRAALAKHLPVLIIGPPVFPPAQNHPDRVRLRSVLRAVASSLGAQYVDTATALGAPRYTSSRPCQSGETGALGCVHDRVTVRSGNGIHFDPPRRVTCAGSGMCTYSAGGHRFADVVLTALARIEALHVGQAPPDSGVPIIDGAT